MGMNHLLALALFGLALGSVLLAAVGTRMLLADMRLKHRLVAAQDASRQQRAKASYNLPSIFQARGRDRTEIEQKLRSAGYFGNDALDRFVWLRFIASISVAALVLLTTQWKGFGLTASLFLTFVGGGLTFIGAKLALHMKASKRERKLMVEFPFLLDLMLMMLESGVSLDQCFRSIAQDEKVAVPRHAKLLGMLVDDLDRGQNYQLAFDRWAMRVGVSGSRELAARFRQSLFQGMELVPALREFNKEFAQRRVARAREEIGKITVRMVVLMLIFFMPALFIVLAGPPVTAIFDTLGNTP